MIECILLLFGGFDTTSHLLTSCLYQLKKNPEVMSKLAKSLDQNRITQIDQLDEAQLKDAYENCDYLNYVIKETFRIDGPAIFALLYSFKKDTTICGVPFNKGLRILPNALYSHYNPNEWHEPRSFIPERFDPESEYFFKPNSDKQPRHPKSFMPFGFGPRNCMGQSLAKLEAKVVLSRILTTVDYEIDQDLLDNEYISLSIISQFKLFGKIKDNL